MLLLLLLLLLLLEGSGDGVRDPDHGLLLDDGSVAAAGDESAAGGRLPGAGRHRHGHGQRRLHERVDHDVHGRPHRGPLRRVLQPAPAHRPQSPHPRRLQSETVRSSFVFCLFVGLLVCWFVCSRARRVRRRIFFSSLIAVETLSCCVLRIKKKKRMGLGRDFVICGRRQTDGRLHAGHGLPVHVDLQHGHHGHHGAHRRGRGPATVPGRRRRR